MDDIFFSLVQEHRLWQKGAWIAPARLSADVKLITKSVSGNSAVIPSFNNGVLFLAGFLASVSAAIPMVLASNNSPDILLRLKQQYDRLLLMTDFIDPNSSFDEQRTLFVSMGHDSIKAAPTIFVKPDQVVLDARTSGSTGLPASHLKSWGALVSEADTVGESLQLHSSARHVISTVPLSHMYGFTYAFLGPLRWGLSIDAERPTYPRDLARVLSGAPGKSWVVTTPTHLRAYVSSAENFTRLAGFICSAAPLPLDLAYAVERRYSVPVIETYGSTETGAIGWRQPTHDDYWTTYDALTVSGTNKLCVCAHYLPPEGQLLDDRVELLDNRRFRVIGRSSDLVKIAGKRASLAELSEILCNVNGVTDGVFVQPPTSDDSAGFNRLAAFVVLDGGTQEQVLADLRERIDPLFLPRPLSVVEQIPRNSNGKLTKATLDSLWGKHHTDRAINI